MYSSSYRFAGAVTPPAGDVEMIPGEGAVTTGPAVVPTEAVVYLETDAARLPVSGIQPQSPSPSRAQPLCKGAATSFLSHSRFRSLNLDHQGALAHPNRPNPSRTHKYTLPEMLHVRIETAKFGVGVNASELARDAASGLLF